MQPHNISSSDWFLVGNGGNILYRGYIEIIFLYSLLRTCKTMVPGPAFIPTVLTLVLSLYKRIPGAHKIQKSDF